MGAIQNPETLTVIPKDIIPKLKSRKQYPEKIIIPKSQFRLVWSQFRVGLGLGLGVV